MPENRLHLGNLGPGDVALLKQVADEAAQRAVEGTFLKMGLDTTDPIGAQRDFALLRDLTEKSDNEAFQADLRWVRTTRTRMDGIIGKALLTAVAVAVVGAAHTLWAGFTGLLGKH